MNWITAERSEAEGPPLTINCPKCRAASVRGIPRVVEEPIRVLHLVTVFTFRNVFVRCEACGQSLVSSTNNLDELYRLSPAALSNTLTPYTSGVGRALVILALALFWFPFLAPLLAIGGYVMTRRHPRWRRLAILSLVLSFVVAAAVGVLLMTSN
jgi:hypothetical protein